MIRHPFEFVLNRFIRPNGLTQKQLCSALGLGAKTLSELYGGKRKLTPLTALKVGRYFNISPHLLMSMQAEWDLAEAEKQYETEIKAVPPYEKSRMDVPRLPASNPSKHNPPSLLLSTLNTSIGDPKKHLTRRELVQLFYTRRVTAKKAYAIRTLFTEASIQEIVDFVKAEKIEPVQVKYIYEFYLNKLNGRRNPYAEWLVQNI